MRNKRVWFIVLQPLAFVIYFLPASLRSTARRFDMPEAEQELTAGYHTEYSGMKFALFFMAEYIKMICIAMIGASLFLGGFQRPFVENARIAGADLFVRQGGHLAFRADLDPRHAAAHPLRPADGLGWKVLFPLAVFNVLITAVVLVFLEGS